MFQVCGTLTDSVPHGQSLLPARTFSGFFGVGRKLPIAVQVNSTGGCQGHGKNEKYEGGSRISLHENPWLTKEDDRLGKTHARARLCTCLSSALRILACQGTNSNPPKVGLPPFAAAKPTLARFLPRMRLARREEVETFYRDVVRERKPSRATLSGVAQEQ